MTLCAIVFAVWHTTILEPATRTARADAVAAELFYQFLISMYDLVATFDFAF